MLYYKPLGHDEELLQDDYSHAEIDLLWRRDRSTRELVLSLVQLAPTEFPVLEHRTERKARMRHLGKDCELNFQRFSIPLSDALEWIESFKAGRGSLPGQPQLGFAPVKMGLEPDHGGWNVSTGYPFSGTGESAYLRTKHWVSESPSPAAQAVWNDQRAVEWIRSVCGITLKDNPMWCGSIHLVAPNPLYRTFDQRLVDGPNGDQQMLVAFNPRSRKEVTGLQLMVCEVRPNGIGTLHSITVETPQFVLDRSGTMEQVAVAVTCPRRGLLEWHGPVGWFGKRHPNQLPRRLHTQSWQNQNQEKARELDVQWFYKDENAARTYIKGLFARASRSILIVDPYFAESEIALLDGAIYQRNVTLTVLTSEERLRRSPDDADENDYGGARLAAHVEEMKRQCKIEVLVSRKLLIHDRFIVIDDVVRVSGNSLQAIGSRGSLVMRIPEATSILADIAAVKDAAVPLENWIARQQKKASRKIRPAQLDLFSEHPHGPAS